LGEINRNKVSFFRTGHQPPPWLEKDCRYLMC
jgi:hypothetical protein